MPPTSTPLPATATPTATPNSGVLVQDTFTRSVSSGWGSADLGGSYATPASNSADYRVTNGMGQLNLPAASTSREQILSGAGAASAQDVEISVIVSADTIPTGSTELRLGAIARQVSSGNLYRAVTRFIPGGSVKLQAQKVVAGTESWLGTSVTVSGLTVTAGSWVRVRLQVTGANPTTIRMRAWADGSSEPTTWQYTTTDNTATALQTAGTFGLRAQLTSGATNAPIVARFDDWAVSSSLSAAAPTREQRADAGSGVRAASPATSHQPPATSVEAAVSSRPPRTQASLPNPDSPIFTSFGKALLRQLQQSIPTTTRTITYDYDGLQRLTSAIENPGTNQTYSYDLAGNRTGVWVNGTRTQNLTYNAANQVSGWSYDAAGNLLTDGTTAYTYDALNRVLSTGSTSNTYNADGTLVAQTVSSVTTRYTQDLAAPLSQILSNGTQRYVYGNPAERLFAQQGSAARTWYSVDALGSVRATLSDAGIPQAAASYDAWGVPETPLIGSFGFTGELQHGSDVWLRARWYGAGRGSFGSRDPYAGDVETPYSMMPYQYAYAAPTVSTDPSGFSPTIPSPLLLVIAQARHIYDKNGSTRDCTKTPDNERSNLTDTVSDLVTDYICEYGSSDRIYEYNARLTRELALSNIVTKARLAFYRTGGKVPYETGGQMGLSEFIGAKIDDTMHAPIWTKFAGLSLFLSITDFLGGFDYLRIRRDTYQGRDTLRFEIKNTTDLTSGTRIPFVASGRGAISLEEYVANPRAYNRDFTKFADLQRLDTSRFRILSILSPKVRRNSTSKTGLGGGTMTQLFRWEEPYVKCPYLGGTAIQDYHPREFYPTN